MIHAVNGVTVKDLKQLKDSLKEIKAGDVDRAAGGALRPVELPGAGVGVEAANRTVPIELSS